LYREITRDGNCRPSECGGEFMHGIGSWTMAQDCGCQELSENACCVHCDFEANFYFFGFRTGFRSINGGRLIRLVRRGMHTGQTLFLWDSNPVFPGHVFGRSSLSLKPKKLGYFEANLLSKALHIGQNNVTPNKCSGW